MPQFDLRYAIVQMRDGTRVVGAINQSGAAPANGDTHVTVNGFSAAIPIGSTVSFVGSTGTYTVTAVTGGSTPTAITFTPPLSTALGIPGGTAVATIGPNFIRVKIGEGTLQYTEKKKYKYIRNQGVLDGVITDDDETMDLTFDFTWEFISSLVDSPPLPEECLKNIGNAANWLSSSPDPCQPYCIDIILIYNPPCPAIPNETFAFEQFRYDSLDHNSKDAKIACKGQCNINEAVITRG